MPTHPHDEAVTLDQFKQASYDVLEALLATADAAANNPLNSREAQDAAFDLCTRVSDQLDALDLDVFTANTAALKAATERLREGCKDLKALKERIGEIGDRMKECAEIVAGIGQVISKAGELGLF